MYLTGQWTGFDISTRRAWHTSVERRRLVLNTIDYPADFFIGEGRSCIYRGLPGFQQLDGPYAPLDVGDGGD